MKQNSYPAHIQSKLDELAQTSEYLTEQVGKTKDAIAGARQRLSGGFQTDQEFTDLRATLDQLVADLPVLERKQRDASSRWRIVRRGWRLCRAMPCSNRSRPAKSDDDLDLDDIRQRIDDIQDEIGQLRAVPTPAPDVEKRIKAYVARLARPRVSGVAAGQTLRVDWPTTTSR